jgi:hypothetical protein
VIVIYIYVCFAPDQLAWVSASATSSSGRYRANLSRILKDFYNSQVGSKQQWDAYYPDDANHHKVPMEVGWLIHDDFFFFNR